MSPTVLYMSMSLDGAPPSLAALASASHVEPYPRARQHEAGARCGHGRQDLLQRQSSDVSDHEALG
jgi:hypothetical protein